MIVDATCRSRADRAVLLDGLRGVGYTLLIVRCEVPLELALERAARRLDDPQRMSDATPQIAEEQFRASRISTSAPRARVLRLDATQVLDAQIAEVARAVDRRGLGGRSPATSAGEPDRRDPTQLIRAPDDERDGQQERQVAERQRRSSE